MAENGMILVRIVDDLWQEGFLGVENISIRGLWNDEQYDTIHISSFYNYICYKYHIINETAGTENKTYIPAIYINWYRICNCLYFP